MHFGFKGLLIVQPAATEGTFDSSENFQVPEIMKYILSNDILEDMAHTLNIDSVAFWLSLKNLCRFAWDNFRWPKISVFAAMFYYLLSDSYLKLQELFKGHDSAALN